MLFSLLVLMRDAPGVGNAGVLLADTMLIEKQLAKTNGVPNPRLLGKRGGHGPRF